MKKNLTIVLILFCSTFIFAQKAKIIEGSFKNLKGIAEFNLEFDYTDIEIPKYDSEEEFLKDKVTKYNNDISGSGDEFKLDWFDDREEQYEPKFIESFNKRFDQGEVKVDRNLEEAEYTLNVHTTFMYAGYNVGVVRKNSKVDAVISVYKNDNPDKILYL